MVIIIIILRVIIRGWFTINYRDPIYSRDTAITTTRALRLRYTLFPKAKITIDGIGDVSRHSALASRADTQQFAISNQVIRLIIRWRLITGCGRPSWVTVEYGTMWCEP